MTPNISKNFLLNFILTCKKTVVILTLVENTFYQSLFLFQQEQIPGFVHVFKWTIPNLANHVRDQRTIAFRSPPLQIDNRVFSCIYVVRHNETGRTARRSHGIYLEICEGSILVFVSGWLVAILCL